MTNDKPRILVATGNAGKLAEFQRLLRDRFLVDGITGRDLTLPPEGDESYRQNAEAKAKYVAEQTGRLTLGDDSGLEVQALGGLPGVISARYGGFPVSDQRNIEKLLTELEKKEGTDRAARFVCWIALADANGLIGSSEGTCNGSIGHTPHGSHGFGYDPVFVLPDGRTMAELTDLEKDVISHRGNALRSMIPVLNEYVVAGDDYAKSR